MVDCGADRSFISYQCASELNLEIDRSKAIFVTGFNGESMMSLGSACVRVELRNPEETQEVMVQMVVIDNCPAKVVLGRTFLNNRAIIDHVKGCATFFTASSKIDNNSKVVDKVDSGVGGVAEIKENKNMIAHCSVVEKKELDCLFEDFACLFDAGESQKCMPEIEMKIETISSNPIKEKTRKVKDNEIGEMKDQVDTLLKRQVIKESNSPWAFAALLVPKKNGKSRLCVDYRKLNKITIADCFPMPRIENIFKLHAHKQIFSSLDCRDGFFHLRIREEDRPKTSFTTPFGQYEYSCAPFGLRNTPNVFQRCMQKVLEPVKSFCEPFVDDILISSNSLEEHCEHLRKVFECLSAANLTLNKDKCTFATSEVPVLGHILSRDGLRANEISLEKVRNFPKPKNKREVQSFLGLVNYLAKFINNIAKEVLPLRKLIRQSSDFIWRAHHEEAFENIKKLLTDKECKLSFNKPGCKKIIHIESDNETVAAMFIQIDHEISELIDCKSRTLSDTETRYSPIEREALALQLAFSKFGIVIGSEKVIVKTSLPEFGMIISRQTLPSRLARLVLDCQAYDFVVECDKKCPKVIVKGYEQQELDFLIPNIYIDGACEHNGKPDCRASYGIFWGENHPLNTSGIIQTPASNQRAELTAAIVALQQTIDQKITNVRLISDSRYVVDSQTSWIREWEKNGFVNSKGKPVLNSDLHIKLRDLTKQCNVIWQHVPGHSGIIGNVAADKLATEALGIPTARLCFVSISDDIKNKQSSDVYTKRIIDELNSGVQNEKFCMQDGVLIRRTITGDRVVLPSKLRSLILHLNHDGPAFGGHNGELRTYKQIESSYWWPKMKHDVIDYVQSCHQCQLFRPHRGKASGSLKPIVASQINQIIGLDFVGPLPLTLRGNRFIAVCIDYFSKWVVTRALPSITAEKTADFILEDLVCQHGVPGQIITDQGPQFSSFIYKSLLKSLQIDQTRTTAYHPQSNGMVERANGSIIRSLKKYASKDPKNWDLVLPLVTFSHNTAINSSIKFTPFEIQKGRQANIFPTSAKDESQSDYVQRLSERIQHIERVVKTNESFAQDAQKSNYDWKRKLIEYDIGSKVLVKDFVGEGARKFKPLFKGPFSVERKSKDGLSYLINFGNSSKWTSVQNIYEYKVREINNDLSETLVSDYCSKSDDYRQYMPFVSCLYPDDNSNSETVIESADQLTTTIEKVTSKDDHVVDLEFLDDIENGSSSTEIYQLPEPISPVPAARRERVSEFTCSICNKLLSSKQSLDRHRICHSKEYPFHCSKCQRGFITKENCLRHEKQPHPSRFVCNICGYNYDNQGNLRKHQQIHVTSS